MTVSVTTATSGPFLGNAATTAFPFTFKAMTAAEVQVYVDEVLASTADYTVTVNDSGGTVTFGTAPATGASIVIVSNPSFDQEIAFTNSGPFLADSHDEGLDRGAIRDIYLGRRIDGSLRGPITETMAEGPSAADRSNKYLAFDADGNPVASFGTGADSGLRDDLGASDGWQFVGGVREPLTEDREYYVDATLGSDANDGLSPATAFATIPKAVGAAYGLDLNGHNITVNVADGTYTAPIRLAGSITGSRDNVAKHLKIIGNEATPANVILSITSNNAVELRDCAYLMLAGVKITVATDGAGFVVDRHSTLEHRNCVFGDVAGGMITAQRHGMITQIKNDDNTASTLTIADAAAADSFCHVTEHSRVAFTSQKIAWGTGATFTTYVWGLNDATVAIDSATFTGSRPTGNTLIHDHSLLNAYSLTNAGGWGFLGDGTYKIEDGSMVTADGLTLRTFYVRSDADGDTNDGLESTTARAFKTIQAAVDFIAELPFNPANYSASDGVHINIADGTYGESVVLRDMKAYRDARLTGNVTTPANVAINGTANGVGAAGLATTWTVEGVKIAAAAGTGLTASNSAQVNFQNIQFGSCSGYQVSASYGAVITATGDYSIAAGGIGHIQALYGGVIDISSRTVTLTGTPAFSSPFARAFNNAAIRASGTTYSGSATGKRYDARTCSSIDTNGAGATALPGDTAGTTASGGQYA